MGMAAGECAGGASVEATEFAAGELVEKLAAGIVGGLALQYLAAEIAQLGEPITGVKWKERVDLLTQTLGQSGTCACGGDGNLQVSATDDGGEVEVAEGWIVHRIDEDSRSFCFGKDGAIDCWIVGCGDDKEVSCEVAKRVLALIQDDLA